MHDKKDNMLVNLFENLDKVDLSGVSYIKEEPEKDVFKPASPEELAKRKKAFIVGDWVVIELASYEGDDTALQVTPDPMFILVNTKTGDTDCGYRSQEEALEAAKTAFGEGKVPDLKKDKPGEVIAKLTEKEPEKKEEPEKEKHELEKFPVTQELVDDLIRRLNVGPEIIGGEFWKGLEAEQEHIGVLAELGGDIKELVAKIALDHLKEIPDYYTRLEKMEEEAKKAEPAKETPKAEEKPKEEVPPSESKMHEGTWAFDKTKAKNVLETLEKFKKDTYNIIGDDKFFDGLDIAIKRVQQMILDMPESKMTEEPKKKEDVFKPATPEEIDKRGGGHAVCDQCGEKMLPSNKGCWSHVIDSKGKWVERIPYGGKGEDTSMACGDCNVKGSAFHHYGCDTEQCPKCHGQLAFCDCDWKELGNRRTRESVEEAGKKDVFKPASQKELGKRRADAEAEQKKFPRYRNIVMSGDNVEGEEFSEYMQSWFRFSAYFPLMVIRKALSQSDKAAREIWELQDGMPGTTPEEVEWDWSAIRDSSDESRNAMYEVAKKYIDIDAFRKHLEAAKGKAEESKVNEQEPTKYTVVADDIADEADAKKIQATKVGSTIEQDPKTKKYRVTIKEYAGRDIADEKKTKKKKGKFPAKAMEISFELCKAKDENEAIQYSEQLFSRLSAKDAAILEMATRWLNQEIKKSKAQVTIESIDFGDVDMLSEIHEAIAYFNVVLEGKEEELAKIGDIIA